MVMGTYTVGVGCSFLDNSPKFELGPAYYSKKLSNGTNPGTLIGWPVSWEIDG